jgi:soluble lytic murein transglycosylase-like protein
VPQPSGRAETEVAYAAPETLSAVAMTDVAQPSSEPLADSQPSAQAFPPPPSAQSFAGSQPSAVKSGGNVFLEPEPVALQPRTRPFQLPEVAGGSDDVNRLIEKYAAHYDLPVAFVRRVVKRESNFRPSAFNRGHWGLMQIKHATARGMGYRGPAKGLLDAETNLIYAVKYLAGAWLVADGNPDLADRLYQRGYYYDAKRKGLLDETGLGRDRVRKRRHSI